MGIDGPWGYLSSQTDCPPGDFVTGFQTKSDQDGLDGLPGDFQGLTGLRLRCSDLPTNTTLTTDSNDWGIWDPAGYQVCPGGYQAMRAQMQSPSLPVVSI